MIRFWFEFYDPPKLSPLSIGCGITAVCADDAISILRECVDRGAGLKISKMIKAVDLSDLDQGHVIPNMGVVAIRGVWFPQGFA